MFFLPDDVDRDFGVCSHSCDAAGDGDRDDGDGDDDGDDDGDGNGDHHDGSDDKEALDNGVCMHIIYMRNCIHHNCYVCGELVLIHVCCATEQMKMKTLM